MNALNTKIETEEKMNICFENGYENRNRNRNENENENGIRHAKTTNEIHNIVLLSNIICYVVRNYHLHFDVDFAPAAFAGPHLLSPARFRGLPLLDPSCFWPWRLFGSLCVDTTSAISG